MTVKQQREIVIEFERVQLIRKRARTRLASCDRCGIVSDVVSLIEAAELFETDHENLLQFIRQNDCHFHVGDHSKIYLCVVSLLDTMKRKNNIRRLMA